MFTVKTNTGKTVLAFCLAFLICLAALPARASWVTVVGRAAYNGNDAVCEQQAINQALNKAVEQEAGTLIEATTNVSQAQVVKDEVLAGSRGYVSRHRVLSSGPSSDGRTYIVTLEALVDSEDLKRKIISMEDAFSIRQKQMKNKNVIVLGIKQFDEDFAWATKPFEVTVQMAKDKLSQAQFIVLDEGAMENFQGVARLLKQGNFRKPSVYEQARAAGADWMVVVAMDATRHRADADHAFNQVSVQMRLELIDVNTGALISAKYEKAKSNLNTGYPRYADWQEAVTDAARTAAENGITDMVNNLMLQNRHFQPTEPQRYLVRFERFQASHVDSIVSDLKAMDGVSSIRLLKQKDRFTVAQVMYTLPVAGLRNGLKDILHQHGYTAPRIDFAGNSLTFRNTLRF
ncbi:hypothetical protein [Dethiosulfatarculus sandiegensis]|uniref:Flagellar assembly protein T N-terminal domain-containing protein n=1 Tax=Dethiosulfatarculus sandiegensis TaxID=1429043 RepID=A0A0D2JNZ3_9BACT|nr:hypothetical protein [Dethiosulfatarculus sandiegensis]KIX11215.1 hypothetical protein X474_25475 [Dethiosulfatarculus sandiegensis]